jgi:conjugative relaxase-like TrwC/TraI family protein
MITARAQRNLATAKLYFREHLSQGDAAEMTVAGQWFGRGASRLGLGRETVVSLEAFERLCENRHPLTGNRLTVRQVKDRRVFYDFVISAPKSVSILALAGGDDRLVVLHDKACRRAIECMEESAATRVRVGGRDEDRVTGEFVAAGFRHDCSRSLDPQLHTHVVVFNATFDSVEQRWKALQAGEIYEAINFYTEVYRSELAAGLKDLGYRLRSTRNGFEIDGVSPEIIRRFSKRRQEIEEKETVLAKKLRGPLSNNGRATLAHASRAAKPVDKSSEELRAFQRAQLSSDDFAQLAATVHQAGGIRRDPINITAGQALDHGRDHLFERASAVKRHDLLREALAFGRGDVREDELSALLPARSEFVHVGRSLTTRETLRLERELIAWVNAQSGRYRAFATTVAGDLHLNHSQRCALEHLARSTDGVTRIGGGAGTGKTVVLTAFVKAVKTNGHQVFACAPTTGAVEVLRGQGFADAQTVQRILVDKNLQQEITGRVLLVDEANLLSVKQLHALFYIAKNCRCRVVLSGDTRQHHSVEAGDALRVLETQSQLRSVRLDHIQRQKPADYRKAVSQIALGQLDEAYRQLDRLGAIVEVKERRYDQLASEMAESVRRGKSALIVSPTWHEIARVTAAVRSQLKHSFSRRKPGNFLPECNFRPELLGDGVMAGTTNDRARLVSQIHLHGEHRRDNHLNSQGQPGHIGGNRRVLQKRMGLSPHRRIDNLLHS